MQQIVAPLQQAVFVKVDDKGRASLVAAQETGQADNSTVSMAAFNWCGKVDTDQ